MHTCPECGQACTCCADIEDHDTGDEFVEECDHFMQCAAAAFEDEFEAAS